MTPINPAAAGGLPEYARQDVVSSGVGTAPVDPAYQQQSIDPSQPGFQDPYATTYDQYSAPYEANVADQYGSAVAGLQPATTGGGPAATIDDFVQLGIFTQDELVQLSQMNMSPQEMTGLYQEAVAFMQTPEFAQWAQGQGAVAPQSADPQMGEVSAGEVPAGEVAAGQAPAGGDAPAWSKKWNDKFTDMMKEQGLDSKTRMMVIASLKASGLGEAQLQQGFEYYASTPEGKAELQAANDQVKAGVAKQDKMMLTFGGAAVGIGGIATAIGASRGNLVKALERTAAGGSEHAGSATKALNEIRAGRPLTTALRAEIVSSMRGEAGLTSRFRHPIAKASLNGAARNLTPSTRISFKEAMKYGLGMKFGDAANDAVAGAAKAAGSVDEVAKAGSAITEAVAGSGDDAIRAVAGSVDDVGKVAATGAAQAAKGVGMLGKVGKVLGPVGLALSAGVGIWGIKKTMDAEGGFGEESAKMTGNVAGGIAGGVAGAAAGAAIGSVVPVIGTGIGAVVGGIAGSIGLSKIGESVGGFLHGLFD